MSKHTPGPWRVEGDLGFTVIDNSGTIICQMPYTMTAMQHYANARLIVAAPEMYELIQLLAESTKQDYAPSISGAKKIHALHQLQEAAQKLLAKIEGGEE